MRCLSATLQRLALLSVCPARPTPSTTYLKILCSRFQHAEDDLAPRYVPNGGVSLGWADAGCYFDCSEGKANSAKLQRELSGKMSPMDALR